MTGRIWLPVLNVAEINSAEQNYFLISIFTFTSNGLIMHDCLGCGHRYPAGHWMYYVSEFIEDPFFWAFIIALFVIVILLIRRV